MAAKKPKKEKTGNPNVVLVIFLIFFVLLTIALGVWVYYDQDAIAKAETDRKAAKAGFDSEKQRRDFYVMVTQELRLALGQNLEPDELLALETDRDAMVKGTKFKDEKAKEAMEKLIEGVRATLGGVDEAKKPKTNYSDKLKAVTARADTREADLNKLVDKVKRTEDHFNTLTESQATFHKNALASIQKGNDAAFAATQKAMKSTADIVENFRKAVADLNDKTEEINNLKEEHTKELNKPKNEIAKLKLDRAQDVGAAPVNQTNDKVFPLVLDISPGRPLWDRPVGEITRVDPDLRQVAINVGHAQGAKPELTFNIFGSNQSGKAEGQLKGSLQIIRVVDSNTSLARIISLYDAEGREIALTDLSRARVLRESEAPIRVGDKLFNLFWGARVAIAGYVNITGEPSDNPAEQIRQMNDFAYLCERQGMTVDAYVDLRDGTVKGTGITPKTRYLILGDPLRTNRPAKKDDGDEAAKEPADRNTLVNEASVALHKQAIANGLLLISAENFATVIGYRRPRSANDPGLSSFRPSLPVAGVAAPRLNLPPREEKKEDMNMKEKDRENP